MYAYICICIYISMYVQHRDVWKFGEASIRHPIKVCLIKWCPFWGDVDSHMWVFRISVVKCCPNKLYEFVQVPIAHPIQKMFQNVFSQFLWDANVFTRVGFRISVVGFNLCCTEWRRPIGCFIFISHFPQKSPIINGSFAESDLQLTASYGSSPPCRIFFDSRFQRTASHPSMTQNVCSLFF